MSGFFNVENAAGHTGIKIDIRIRVVQRAENRNGGTNADGLENIAAAFVICGTLSD